MSSLKSISSVVATVLRADSSWANPFVLNVNAHLQDDLDSGPSTHVLPIDRDASLFPSMDHLVLANPLVCIHYTIMRWLVQVNDILEADIEALVMTAEAGYFVVTCDRELCLQMVAIVHLDFLALEELVKLVMANVVVLNLNAHPIHDVLQVFLADKLLTDLEAATMAEGILQVFLRHTLDTVVCIFPASWLKVLRLRLEVLNDNRVARADLESVNLHAFTKEK